MMKIIVVDDHAVVRNGLCGLLARQSDMEMVASADNAKSALKLMEKGTLPDIIVTDLNMPGMDGMEFTRRVAAQFPSSKVIILSFHAQANIRKRALAAGARGCLSKDGDLDELLTLIRAVHADV
jgi:DNA-binding NarL/FixJ family response regulator